MQKSHVTFANILCVWKVFGNQPFVI